MRELSADLRYAARALIARPGFTAAAVLTLTLGIGMTTAIFGIVNGVVLQPLPLPNADRLVSLCEQHPGATPDWCSIAPPNVQDIAARSRSIEAVGIARGWSVTLTTPAGPENINAGIATPGAFAALGFRAQAGRLLETSDVTGRPGAVAVLSHDMWVSRFGSDRDVVGRTITLDGDPVRIVGVLAPGFAVPLFERVQLWRPVHIDPASEQHRSWPGFVAYGRLRDGVGVRAARAELATLTRGIREQHFAANPRWDVTLQPTQRLVTGSVRQPMLMFLGAVGLVLLIACANVGNLLLARGAARAREMAVRSAIGASRGRIARALLTESLLLALAGAALGTALAIAVVRAFKALAPSGIPRMEDVAIDSTVLAFALALAVVTALVFGLVPALRGSRVDLAQALREGGRGASSGGRLGRVLVVAELAFVLPLISAGAMLAKSFGAMTSWNPGFERDHLATFTLFLPRSAYANYQGIAAQWERLEAEVASVPGVTSVATASAGPLFGARETWEMYEDGTDPERRTTVRWHDVSPSFFATLGISVVRGRALNADDRWDAPSTAVANEALVRRMWPEQDPVGKRLVFQRGENRAAFTVVGVVKDVPPVKPGAVVEPQLYWSNRQQPRPFTYFVVRTAVPPATVSDAVKSRVGSVDASYSVESWRTYPELMSGQVRSPRFNMALIATFGLLAMVLAAIGTYGLLAYQVAQRTRELGVRLALGARPRALVLSVLGSGARLAGLGAAIGLVGALLLARVLAGFVSGVSPRDPVILVASAGTVLLVAIVACLVPALRASRVDPATTLAAD